MSTSAGVPTHYSLFSRTVHWLVVILMAGMFFTGFTMRPPGPVPGGIPIAGHAGAPAGFPGLGAPGGPPAMAMAGNLPAGFAPPGMPPMSPWRKISLHKAMGFTILMLALLRIGYRVAFRLPAMAADTPKYQVVAARGVQGLIYLGMIVQPLSGWLASPPFTYLGLFTVPRLSFIPLDREALEAVHNTVDWILLALIFLHAAAALYHHYVRKDNVLISMVRGG